MAYAVIQPGYAIFGIGETLEDAWAEARYWADVKEDGTPNVDGLKAYPCTQAVVNAAARWGHNEFAWGLADGIIDLRIPA